MIKSLNSNNFSLTVFDARNARLKTNALRHFSIRAPNVVYLNLSFTSVVTPVEQDLSIIANFKKMKWVLKIFIIVAFFFFFLLLISISIFSHFLTRIIEKKGNVWRNVQGFQLKLLKKKKREWLKEKHSVIIVYIIAS